jgi:hypothetical protein
MQAGRSINRNPKSLSDYDRTFNKAIDLVAEALGHANKISNRMVAAIVLKPTMYDLFVEGLKYITAQRGHQWQEGTEIAWEGVKVLRGPRGQFDSLRYEYVENAIKMPVKNQ